MQKNLVAHEVTGLFPEMTTEEYQALKHDIERNGLREPILTHKDQIVDGRGRYRACTELDIEPRSIPWDGKGPLVDAVISRNLQRRHLNSGQKAVVALKLEKLLAGEAKANMRAGGGDKRSANARRASKKVIKPVHSAKMAARLVGTNTTYVAAAKSVEKNAPELLKAVTDRHLSLKEAKLLCRKPAEMRAAIVEKIASGQTKKYKAALELVRGEAKPSQPQALLTVKARYRLFCDTVENLVDRAAPDALDIIITDPPYPREYLRVYESLAKLAAKILKPGGSLIVMVGHAYLPEVFDRMRPHMNYHWQCLYDMPGSQVPVWGRKVHTSWKPLLWFVKGEYKSERQLSDRFDKSDRPSKDYHKWGQSVRGMIEIVERFSKPGDVILDPFLGGGTTGIAALMTGRRFVGVDCDERAVQTSRARIEEYLRKEWEARAKAA